MLRKPGDPRSKPSSSSRSSTRNKAGSEKPDDIVRKLQRLSFNKKCADCQAKAPGAANLTHGTIVCLTCAGIQ